MADDKSDLVVMLDPKTGRPIVRSEKERDRTRTQRHMLRGALTGLAAGELGGRFVGKRSLPGTAAAVALGGLYGKLRADEARAADRTTQERRVAYQALSDVRKEEQRKQRAREKEEFKKSRGISPKEAKKDAPNIPPGRQPYVLSEKDKENIRKIKERRDQMKRLLSDPKGLPPDFFEKKSSRILTLPEAEYPSPSRREDFEALRWHEKYRPAIGLGLGLGAGWAASRKLDPNITNLTSLLGGVAGLIAGDKLRPSHARAAHYRQMADDHMYSGTRMAAALRRDADRLAGPEKVAFWALAARGAGVAARAITGARTAVRGAGALAKSMLGPKAIAGHAVSSAADAGYNALRRRPKPVPSASSIVKNSSEFSPASLAYPMQKKTAAEFSQAHVYDDRGNRHTQHYEKLTPSGLKQLAKDVPVGILSAGLGYGLGKTVTELFLQDAARKALNGNPTRLRMATNHLPAIMAVGGGVLGIAGKQWMNELQRRRMSADSYDRLQELRAETTDKLRQNQLKRPKESPVIQPVPMPVPVSVPVQAAPATSTMAVRPDGAPVGKTWTAEERKAREEIMQTPLGSSGWKSIPGESQEDREKRMMDHLGYSFDDIDV